MSLSPSKDVVRRVNRDEMVVFLRKLRVIYDWDDERIMRDIHSVALFGNDMEDLKENPKEVMNVFLPILVSYAKEDAFFQEAIDTLLSKGVAECMKKVTTLRP